MECERLGSLTYDEVKYVDLKYLGKEFVFHNGISNFHPKSVGEDTMKITSMWGRWGANTQRFAEQRTSDRKIESLTGSICLRNLR